MESLSSKITVGVHCDNLRTKSMYINAVVDQAPWMSYDSNDQTAWWCVKTQTALGPDREPVHPEACCGDRGCCSL